jgi:hypothetical protein
MGGGGGGDELSSSLPPRRLCRSGVGTLDNGAGRHVAPSIVVADGAHTPGTDLFARLSDSCLACVLRDATQIMNTIRANGCSATAIYAVDETTTGLKWYGGYLPLHNQVLVVKIGLAAKNLHSRPLILGAALSHLLFSAQSFLCDRKHVGTFMYEDGLAGADGLFFFLVRSSGFRVKTDRS